MEVERTGDSAPLDRFEYATCLDCDRVFHDPGSSWKDYGEPCPMCGVASVRLAWPIVDLGAFDIVDPLVTAPLVEGQMLLPDGTTRWVFPVDTARERSVACVFLCAALEAVLVDALRRIVQRFNTAAPVTEALMVRSRQREGLLRLYADLVGRSAKAVLQEHDGQLGKWFDEWEQLATMRNKIGHGSTLDAAPVLLRSVRDRAFLAASVLHNAAIEVVDAYCADRSEADAAHRF